ncbi:hypothetical protein [Desulfonema magnum]|uniref:Uncharacterized protein n=1 Tax=Desulfonema magnum TaxID=45655 RepID=A0A975BPS8_9BACT|nr:hypothetical protein [Desulfonema magnum]QTA89360.1 Uncharacterized protein dnm_054110 [Desulfonema magnum]
MRDKIIKFIIVMLVCGSVYFLLTNHIIFYTGGEELQWEILPKTTISFEETFVSLETGEYGGLKSILEKGTLQEDGLGAILVEWELISEDGLRRLEEEIAAEE